MKWRLALRLASLPSERWIVKVAEWNPELSSRYKTYRAIGGPGRRWEDDINEFTKLEETKTEISTESDNKYKKSWIKATKDRRRWTLSENDYTKTAEERSENNARHRRNPQSRPARYVNGVRLSDDEVANITWHTVSVSTKKSPKVKMVRNLEKQQQFRTSHVAGTSKG